MIKFDKVRVVGFEEAVRGVRNIDGSWENSDSYWTHLEDANSDLTANFEYFVGDEDLKKMLKYRNRATTDYRKFIVVYADITAPFYWWSDFDKATKNNYPSCFRYATNYINSKPFEIDDFSWKELPSDDIPKLRRTIERLNNYREDLIKAITTDDEKLRKEAFGKISKNLPNCYNYTKTVALNYDVLRNLYGQKLDTFKEWWSFYIWAEQLPYSKLITFDK